MSDLDPHDAWYEPELEDPVAEARGIRAARRLRRVAVPLATVSATASGVSLLAAASLLANADLGTSLRARGCDLSPLPALLLFVLAGALLVLALRLVALRRVTTALDLDIAAMLGGAAVPVIVLAASLPGTLGCGVARDIARWQLLGDSLTGIGGVAVCAAAALAVGVALAHVVTVHVYGVPNALEDAQPSLVELAMEEADELERDAQLRRFRGVDS